jgi:hypothetical protein
VLFRGSAIMSVYFADGLTLEHNVLEKGEWAGVSMGWGWKDFDGEPGSVQPGNPTTVARDNIVRHNQIIDVMRSLNDSGPLYTLGEQPGSSIHDNYAEGVREGHTYGLHPDEGSAFISFDNNLLDLAPGVRYTINSGTWGRQNNLSITNTYGPSNKIFSASVPESVIENVKVYPDYLWPVAAYQIATNAGLEPGFRDLLGARARCRPTSSCPPACCPAMVATSSSWSSACSSISL